MIESVKNTEIKCCTTLLYAFIKIYSSSIIHSSTHCLVVDQFLEFWVMFFPFNSKVCLNTKSHFNHSSYSFWENVCSYSYWVTFIKRLSVNKLSIERIVELSRISQYLLTISLAGFSLETIPIKYT